MAYRTAIVQPGMFKSPPFSLPAPGYSPVSGETIPRRNPKYLNRLLTTPDPSISTLFDILMQSAAKYTDNDAVGTRKMIKQHEEIRKVKKIVDGKEVWVDKTWTFFEMGDFTYLTYGEYLELCLQLGAGFRKLGLVAGERVHVFAATSAHWLAVSHAAVTQSLPVVTSYATLGEEGLIHSLSQTNAKAIFVDPSLLPNLIHPLHSAPDLKFVIYNNEHEVSRSDIMKLQEAHPSLRILSFTELQQIGKENMVEPVPPHKEDLCCIMYTSGTTGTPKGVPLKHRNIIAAIAGLTASFAEYLSPADSVLAYLPLAHSFEYAFENACLSWGLKMGYGSPRTLSDTSMIHCSGDIKTFRPTVLIGVPAVWELIRKGIEEKVSKMGKVSQGIFWSSLRVKEWLCEYHLPGPGVLDYIVFGNVKREMGGRLRACFNGAGSLGRDTRRFISFAAVPLVMGYGLTETCAMGALQDPLEWTDDTLGDIPGSIEIKLVDFAEANYFTSSDPPQGEILIRGDPVMDGYYKNEEETREAMTTDGWFRTGDIGEWAANGHLKIIDRKKNLVKTLNGEYIALEKLESVYRSSNLISNICIHASPTRQKPLAIILLSPSFLTSLTSSSPSSTHYPSIPLPANLSLHDLTHNEALKACILKDLQSIGRKAGLAPFEIIEAVVVGEEEWSAANGLLTPAQKLNRRHIIPLFQKEIEIAYGGGKMKSVL